MKNSRKAFTMIELIFVIVIIGILASVAIPRLSATRDDAKAAISLSELSLLVREMGNYYTAHENYDTGLNAITNLTNIKLHVDTACANIATEVSSGNSYYYCTDKGGLLESCVSIVPNNSEGRLTLSPINAPSGNICKAVQVAPQFIKNISRTFKMGGERISY
jgi:prepilin-type N-terminal cleavage/methylation domain-containing protein